MFPGARLIQRPPQTAGTPGNEGKVRGVSTGAAFLPGSRTSVGRFEGCSNSRRSLGRLCLLRHVVLFGSEHCQPGSGASRRNRGAISRREYCPESTLRRMRCGTARLLHGAFALPALSRFYLSVLPHSPVRPGAGKRRNSVSSEISNVKSGLVREGRPELSLLDGHSLRKLHLLQP